MGELLGMIAFPIFVLTSFVLGVRLLAMARRTGALPELAIGINFFLAGGVGYSLLIAAESLRVLPEAWSGIGSFAGVTAISLGALAIGVFSHRVFHPGSRTSAAALVALGLWLALGVAGSWSLHVAGETEGAGAWLGRWAPNLGILAAYGWASFEPLRFAARLGRRMRLGFGDPLVRSRMRLWGAGTAAIAAVALLHLVAQLGGRYELPASLIGVAALFVLVTAVTEWLAFFPPRAWLRRFASPVAKTV